MGRSGRPDELDAVVYVPDGKGNQVPRIRQELIVERVRAGVYPETAAVSTGISRATFYRWKAEGEDRVVDGKLRRAKPRMRDFRDALTRAEAEGELRHVALVAKAAEDDWRASAWYLERRSPDRWRRRDSLWHAGPGEGDPGPVTVEGKVNLGGDALDRLGDVLDILSESGALDRPDGGEDPS